MYDEPTKGRLVDFRNLRSVRQIAEEGPAFSDTTIQRWMFHRHRNGLIRAVVEIDANTYIDVRAFNDWLYEENTYTGDFRHLLRVQQVVEQCALPESKLRHWLKYRSANGLSEAVIVKKHREHGAIFIDFSLLNRWLGSQNQNDLFSIKKDYIDTD